MSESAKRQRKPSSKKAAFRKGDPSKKQAVRKWPPSLSDEILVASQRPLFCCMMQSTLFDVGIGYVVVARKLRTGAIGCAMFLVDMYCLGVKDVMYMDMSRNGFAMSMYVAGMTGRFVDVEPAYARKLIRDAAAYAEGLGLAPHEDACVIEGIFGDVDANLCHDVFVFGRDGKPVFINGPKDSPDRCDEIVAALEKACGPDGYAFEFCQEAAEESIMFAGF